MSAGGGRWAEAGRVFGISIAGVLLLHGCATDPTAKYFLETPTRANVIVAPVASAVTKVAIMPFKAETELIGTAVSDAFVTELMRAARYDLVERSQMSKVLSESELALAGLSASKAAEVGKMLGADGVVIGTVDEYSMVAHRGGTYPAVGISARLIDCASGKVMWSVDLARRAESDTTTLAEHGRQIIHEMVAALYRNWGVQRVAAQGMHGIRAGPASLERPVPVAGPALPSAAPAVASPVATPAGTPSLSVGDMGLREVKLAWEPAGMDVKRIRVERGETAAGPFAEIVTVPASDFAFVDRGTSARPLKDGTAYYYRIIPMGSGGAAGAPSSVKESVTAPPPDAPASLKAEATAPRTVALTWSPSTAEGVTNYIVERAPADRPDQFAVRGGVAGASLADGRDAGLADGATYLYRVSAVNRVGARGAPSVLARVTTPSPPPPVAGLSARSGEFRRVSLQWTPSTDPFVVRYDVFRAASMSGPFTRVGGAEGRTVSQFVDGAGGSTPLADGVRAFYRVRAVNSGGGESPDSPVVVALTKPPPAIPVELTATTNLAGRIELAWPPPAEKDVVRFRVEASDSASGPFLDLARSDVSNRCSHTDSGLAAGRVRVYRVRSVDMDGLESPASDPVAGMARPLPPRPASADIVHVSGGVTVTWPALEIASSYRVWRRDGDSWTRLAETATNLISLGFAALPRDTAIGISCVDPEGLESGEKALVQVVEPAPPVPTGVEASKDGLREVVIRWAAPKDNARRYRIERAAAAGGPFAPVGEAEASAARFVDMGGARPSLEDAKDYVYRVAALNQSGRPSDPSETVAASTAPPPAPPSGLKAEAPASRALSLAWDPSPAAGVVATMVERAPKSDPAAYVEVGRVTGASFREGGTAESKLGDSMTWIYRVTATNRVGSVGPPSEPVEVTTLPRPAVVGGLQAKSAEVRCVPMRWEPATERDVVRYDIYRAPARDGEFAKIASVQGRTVTAWLDGRADPGDLADSTAYFYRVRAVNGVTSESEDCEVVSATTRDPPPPVANVDAKSGMPREVPVSWDASPDEKVTGYIVERAMATDTNFAEIARVKGRDNSRWNDRGATRGAGGLGSLPDGATLRYRVVAFNTAKALSPPSAESSASTKPAPAQPSDVVATTDLARSVRLTWKANPEPDIAAYVIESAPEANGRFREQKRVAATAEAAFTWTDDGEPDGAARFYRIKAVDRDTLESAWCATVNGATRPLPDEPTDVKFTWTGAGAAIAWEPPAQTNIASYKVYQKGFFGSKVLASPGTPSHSLSALEVGKGVTLTVTAVDVDGLESVRSKEIEVCPPAPAGP